MLSDVEQQQVKRQLRLFGTAYVYMEGERNVVLNSARVTVYRKDWKAVVDLTKPETNTVQKPKGIKKFIRYMLDPIRVVLGLAFTVAYTEIVWHTITQGRFWTVYLTFYVAQALYYGIRAAREWASEPKSSD